MTSTWLQGPVCLSFLAANQILSVLSWIHLFKGTHLKQQASCGQPRLWRTRRALGQRPGAPNGCGTSRGSETEELRAGCLWRRKKSVAVITKKITCSGKRWHYSPPPSVLAGWLIAESQPRFATIPLGIIRQFLGRGKNMEYVIKGPDNSACEVLCLSA